MQLNNKGTREDVSDATVLVAKFMGEVALNLGHEDISVSRSCREERGNLE